jgi:PAS domain S-box-containing protein
MKILVAEDHPDSRYLLQQLFSGLGHDVAAVADGMEALELLNNPRKTPPDVVVSDALMPRMDGFQLCRALRRHPRWAALPFIFYTATYTDQADEQFALKLGADRFLIKPLEPEQLMAVIHETVARVHSAPPRAPRAEGDDPSVLEEYSRRLAFKLEQKVVELEGANDALRFNDRSLRDLNGQLADLVESLHKEIAERQSIEAALRLREQVLSHAQNLGQIGSYERDPAGTAMVWSDEAFRIVGMEPAPGGVTRQWMLERVHPDDRDRVLKVLREADERMSALEVEHRVVRPDGEIRHVHVRRHVYREADGTPRRIIGIIQDITDRRHAEAQRAKLETQLRQAQKMEAIGNLAGGIAHDFNNVLTAIMAHAELLQLELPRDLGPHLHDSAHEILTASARARDMVRQILTFSRKQPVERKRLDADAVVRDALKTVRATLPPRVELRAELHAERAILGNEAQLHQVVLNLCVNAAHALGDRGGTIDVTLAVADVSETRSRSRPPLRAGEHVLLTVRDTGCGMDAATLERIFEPFFTTKIVGQGTGLGLAVVHGVVQAHDGAIFAESTPGVGTTFSVYLPAIKNVTAPAVGTAGPVTPRGHGQKILFVDDEPSVAKIGARLLERLGYQPTALTDSTIARDRLVNQPDEFDLVITDYLMPRVTGLDLAKAAWAVRPELPMILAVGFGGQLDAAKAKAQGFREFIAKPFAIQTLAEAIARALAK